MDIFNSADLNKLKNVECTLEKGLKNILERLEESNQHLGFSFLDFFEEMKKCRIEEVSDIKNKIQNITSSLWSKLQMLKKNKIGEITDFKKFKQEMVDIQENIFKNRVASRLELKKLVKLEDDLNDELNIYYNGKVAEWSEVLNVNMNCEFVPPKVKCKNSGQCKEVTQFFDFVHKSGGHENQWRKEDHQLFLKLRDKFKKIDTVAFHLHDILPDITIEEIKSHEEWYKKYLHLQSKKKEAINRWKLSKNKNSVTKNLKGNESNDGTINYKECGTKLREKLMQWKAEKEEKLFRERELEKQRLLEKIEKERLETQRQLEIKSIVSEWRESKEILEQTKKQNKKMFEEMEKKRKAALANKLIKRFQSTDELHILKMRQIHKKLTQEPPKRVQSGPPVLRDPNRLMKPTVQWAHKVRALREPLTQPMPIFAAPKLAIPDWRKSIT